MNAAHFRSYKDWVRVIGARAAAGIGGPKCSGLSLSSPPLPGVMLTRRVAAELGSGARNHPGLITTEMVHGRARAPSRQTLRVAANEVRSRVAPRGGTNLFFFISSNGNF